MINLDLGIDIQDDLGRHDLAFHENTVKIPENGDRGCRINATFSIARVPGNFHVSTHAAQIQPPNGNMKHVIHELSFGDTVKVHLSRNNLHNKPVFLSIRRALNKFQIVEHSVH